jgi:hypothetical protein
LFWTILEWLAHLEGGKVMVSRVKAMLLASSLLALVTPGMAHAALVDDGGGLITTLS